MTTVINRDEAILRHKLDILTRRVYELEEELAECRADMEECQEANSRLVENDQGDKREWGATLRRIQLLEAAVEAARAFADDYHPAVGCMPLLDNLYSALAELDH